MSWEMEQIGACTVYRGDCREVLPDLAGIDHFIMDPPFSERTHTGHDASAHSRSDKFLRQRLGYTGLSTNDCVELAVLFVEMATGWIVWMADHTLAPYISQALNAADRYVFAPVPFYAPGRSVRLSGDGPCSWTDWIVVARTAKQLRWGTLPGGYMAGPGWRDTAYMGGKPTALMLELIGDYSRVGDTVCDPFMGSGTTLVACAQLGRKGIGVEIDRSTFDLACQRLTDAYQQPALFPAPVVPPQQLTLGVRR